MKEIHLLQGEDEKIQSLLFNASLTKTIRLILPDFVSRNDIDTLTLASHRGFTLATGDQSCSEQLGRKFMIEVLDHKELSFKKCTPGQLNQNFKKIAHLIDDPELEAESLAFAKKILQDHNLEINLGNKIEAWMQNKQKSIQERVPS